MFCGVLARHVCRTTGAGNRRALLLTRGRCPPYVQTLQKPLRQRREHHMMMRCLLCATSAICGFGDANSWLLTVLVRTASRVWSDSMLPVNGASAAIVSFSMCCVFRHICASIGTAWHAWRWFVLLCRMRASRRSRQRPGRRRGAVGMGGGNTMGACLLLVWLLVHVCPALLALAGY